MQVLYYTTCFFKSFKEKNKVLIVTAEMVSSPVSFCPSAMVPTLWDKTAQSKGVEEEKGEEVLWWL